MRSSAATILFLTCSYLLSFFVAIDISSAMEFPAPPTDAVAASKRVAAPNFVLILSDDQGWNNTEVPMMRDRPDTASDYYQTPNLKRLADQGMTFSQGYAAHSICSPSRHAIQFGMTPARLKKTTNVGATYAEPFSTLSLPQILKQQNPDYRAGHFGKWHMFQEPAALGYDQSDGKTGNETGRHTTTDQTKFWPNDDPKLLQSVTDRSLAFMREQVQQGHPFYLQISHYAIHLNAEARPESLEKHQARQPGQVHTAYWYAAMIDDLDQAVGRVLDEIDTLKIADQTYVVFTSDNGGTARQFPGFNKPLRAGKGSYYEGGLRVPFFVRGPGIDAGSYCDTPVVGYDLFPTFAQLASDDQTLPELPERVEGGSLVHLFQGQNEPVQRWREGLMFYRRLDAVIIQDSMKLKVINAGGKTELFDLKEDLSEAKDLATERPETVTKLQSQLNQWLDDIEGRNQPQPRRRAGRAQQQRAQQQRSGQQRSGQQGSAAQGTSDENKDDQ